MLHPAMQKTSIQAIRENTDSFPSRDFDCPGFLHEKTGAYSFKLLMIKSPNSDNLHKPHLYFLYILASCNPVLFRV